MRSSPLFAVLNRHRWTVVIVWIVLTVGSAALATRLRLDGDMLNLLPNEIPAVKTVRKLQSWHENFAAVMYLGMVRDEHTSVDTLKDFADAVGARLQKSKWRASNVTVAMDVTRVLRAAPLFLDPDDLRVAGEQIDALVKAQRKNASGFALGIDEQDPASADESPTSLLKAMLPRYSGRFQARVLQQAGDSTSDDQTKHVSEKLSLLRTKLDKTGDRLFYISDDGRMLMFLFQPTFKPHDLKHYPELVQEMDEAVAAARTTVPNSQGIEVMKGGSYPLQWDQREQTLADSNKSGWTSGLLILLVVVVTLRRIRLVGLVMLCLVVGLVLSIGLATLVVGSVNVITVFLLAVLAGLGIDFGLYIANRYLNLRREGKDNATAIEQSWTETATPSLMGALTTLVVMVILAFGQFRGFADLGKICGIGILAIYAAMYTLLPVMISWLGHRIPVATNAVKSSEPVTVATSIPVNAQRNRRIMAAMLVITLFAALGATQLRFQYSGEELTVKNQRSLEIDRLVLKHYGENVDQTAVLADSEAEALKIHRYFQDNFGKWSTIARYESVFTYLPPPATQQSALDEIGPLQKAISRMPGRSDDPDTDFALKQIKKLGDARTLTLDELPEIVQSSYVARDANGKIRGFVGAIFATGWLWDFDELKKFVAEIESIRVDGKPLQTTGRPQIFLNVIEIVRKEAALFSAIGLVAIALMFVIQMRSWRFAALALMPLGVGVLWLLGFMPFFGKGGLHLNFVNVIAFPILTGLGVSYGVQVIHAFRIHGSASATVRAMVRPVLGSAVTTLIGWGSLLLASMNGMRSIGWVAVLGIAAITTVSLVLLPALIDALASRGWIRADLRDSQSS